MYGPLLFGLLVALAVLIGFVALWRTVRSRDPAEARLDEYGVGGQHDVGADSDADAPAPRRPWSGANRLLTGFGLGPRLAAALVLADLPVTAAEFMLIVLGAGGVGFLLGTMRLGPALGLALGALCGCLPFLYLRLAQQRRQRALTDQLPQVLTLLVGGLRAGYGLSQGLATLVEQLPPPSSTEFGRVTRAMELGVPVERALSQMAERVGTDDLALVVTAINVQYEMGGNLAQTLEIIGETVRGRIHMLREIRVLTAHQRFTGYVLAAMPLAFAFLRFSRGPEVLNRLFEPGLPRLMLIAAVVMQVLGFVVIRRIVDIEV